jgi:hypothetical protein
MRLSECPPLRRELREDREQDRGRLNVLLPTHHHQHPEPRVTDEDGAHVDSRAANALHQLTADTHSFSWFSSWMPSLHIFTELPHRFEIGRLDSSYWFPRSEPKLSFHLVHGEEPPELAGKHKPSRTGGEVTKVTVNLLDQGFELVEFFFQVFEPSGAVHLSQLRM